jgi:hypothetical protein
MSSSILDRLRAGTVLGAEGYVFQGRAFLHSWTAQA